MKRKQIVKRIIRLSLELGKRLKHKKAAVAQYKKQPSDKLLMEIGKLYMEIDSMSEEYLNLQEEKVKEHEKEILQKMEKNSNPDSN